MSAAIDFVQPPKRAPNYSAPSPRPRILDCVAPFGPGCREWIGYRDKDGYGRLKLDNRTWQAHRLIWTLHYGRIPDGMVVMHTCDNPSCVGFWHLKLGTQQENNRDRHAKGRSVIPGRRPTPDRGTE